MRNTPIFLIMLLMLFLSSSATYAAENLKNTDWVGCWHANPSMTKGEKTILIVDGSFHVTLKRNFGDNVQTAKSKTEIEFHEDIALAELDLKSEAQFYKLVASGWKTQDTYMIFGMLYLYRYNTLFNGIPFRFKKMTCRGN